MKNKYFIYILIVLGMLFVCSILASADEEFFVNDANSVLPNRLDGVYAIGSGGTDLLCNGDVYALTGQGLQKLGSAAAVGGGGLVSEDGTVEIRSDRVKVGLAYSFTEARDSSVPSASLQNSDGKGFSIGTGSDSQRTV